MPGAYTSYFNFYKPSVDELVDVDQHFNRNLDIVDTTAKALFEYQPTDATAVENVFTTTEGAFKYYKTYSNSLHFVGNDNEVLQDVDVNVGEWVDASSLLANGYNVVPGYDFGYRITGYSTGNDSRYVEWRGAIRLNDWDTIPVNSSQTFVTNMPTEVRPSVGKYFHVNAGNTSSSFSIARILIGTGATSVFTRYGNNPTVDSVENKVDFGGVSYFFTAPAA